MFLFKRIWEGAGNVNEVLHTTTDAMEKALCGAIDFTDAVIRTGINIPIKTVNTIWDIGGEDAQYELLAAIRDKNYEVIDSGQKILVRVVGGAVELPVQAITDAIKKLEDK